MTRPDAKLPERRWLHRAHWWQRTFQVLLLALAANLASGAAVAEITVRVVAEPNVAKLGERVWYRGWAVLPPELGSAKWLPPDPDPDVSWGSLVPRRVPGPRGRNADGTMGTYDTLHVQASFQVFRTGTISIPGLSFQVGDGGSLVRHRLPLVSIEVVSVLPPSDEDPALQPPRGPLAAPWWERVPWGWVALGALLLVALIAWFRMRRRAVVAPAPARTAPDPVAEALAALADLRTRQLPSRGLFGEHALVLSGIARRFLEATAGTPRPGDTSRELLDHLRATELGPDDIERIAELLRMWDRVKFARAPSNAAEAGRAEIAVETLVRRPALAPREQAA